MTSTASTGQAGEAYAKNILTARGYEAISLQTLSGHGIDVIGIKQKFGMTFLLAVEVKTTEAKTAGRTRIPPLSALQDDLGEWARNRLRLAVAGTGHYQSISSADRALAQRMLKLIKSGIPAAALFMGVKMAGNRIAAVGRIKAITRIPQPGRLARPPTFRRVRWR
jgi:hypothetical protein